MRFLRLESGEEMVLILAIMALIGFSSYCTLKPPLSRVTVQPPRVTVLPQV
jgi:hypothetical protein